MKREAPTNDTSKQTKSETSNSESLQATETVETTETKHSKVATKFLIRQSSEPQLASVDGLSSTVCPTAHSLYRENETENDSLTSTKEQTTTLKVPAPTSRSRKTSGGSSRCPVSGHSSSSSTIETLPKQFPVTDLFSKKRISETRLMTKSFESAISQTLMGRGGGGGRNVFHKHKDESNRKWYQKFNFADLAPRHHITHQFTVQWLWDDLIEKNSHIMERALNDHAMHSLYEPIKQTEKLKSRFKSEPAIVVSKPKTVPPLSTGVVNKKPSNVRSKSSHHPAASKSRDQLTGQDKSKTQSFCSRLNKLNEWNDQSSLRQIKDISHKPIFLRSQSKCIGDSFLHFLRLMYMSDTTTDDTNTSDAVLIRYVRYLYNLHRNFLSGAASRCPVQSTGSGDSYEIEITSSEENFGQRLKLFKSEGAKKPISLNEYRIFVEYVVNAFRTNIPQLNPVSATYKTSHEALISSIRYQLEKLSLVFLDELRLPSEEDQKIQRVKTAAPGGLEFLKKKLTKVFENNSDSSLM